MLSIQSLHSYTMGKLEETLMGYQAVEVADYPICKFFRGNLVLLLYYYNVALRANLIEWFF